MILMLFPCFHSFMFFLLSNPLQNSTKIQINVLSELQIDSKKGLKIQYDILPSLLIVLKKVDFEFAYEALVHLEVKDLNFHDSNV